MLHQYVNVSLDEQEKGVWRKVVVESRKEGIGIITCDKKLQKRLENIYE